MNRSLKVACIMGLLFQTLLSSSHGFADELPGWGDLKGQFVLEGKIPVQESKPTGRVYCDTVVPEDLVIDSKTKGIRNVFVYLRKAPKSIHPSLQVSKEPELDFDTKDCRFLPHAMVVRTDQTVLLKSQDPFAHNHQPNFLKNHPWGFLIPGVNRKGIPVKIPVAEILPMTIKSDIHPWMSAYWMIVDHPYAAVSLQDGRFHIKKLPIGEHEFRVWHERVGYLNPGRGTKGRLKITIKNNGTTLPPFKLTLDKLTAADD